MNLNPPAPAAAEENHASGKRLAPAPRATRSVHRLLALLPLLGIACTLAGVSATEADPRLAYGVFALGLAATALLTYFVRRALHESAAHESELQARSSEAAQLAAAREATWRAAAAGLFETDARGAWVRANPAAARLLGQPAEALIGEGWLDAFAPEDRKALVETWARLRDTGAAWAGAVKLAGSPARSVWLEVNRLGDRPGFTGCLVDHERTRKLQDELAAREEQSTILRSRLEIAAFDWDVPRGVVSLSAEWSRLLGLPEGAMEVKAADLEAICHPEDSAQVQATAIAALNGATPAYHVEHRVRDAQGHWVWIESHGRVVSRSKDGSALRVLGYNARIDQRKRLEAALRESEQHHREVLDGMHEVLFRTDAAGNWIALNSAWQEITGHSVDESLSRPLAYFVHPEDRSELKHLQRGLTEGTLSEVRHEIRLAGKDGFDRWVELRMRPTRDVNGVIDGASGTLFDMTDRHRAEIELRRAKEIAENANRVKTDFLANVSHEVRTPLHGIVGMTDLLLEGRLEEAQREHLLLIRASTTALLRTLNEVLDFARIEAGKLGIELADFALAPVLQTATKEHAQAAAKKGLSLKLKVQPEVPDGLTGDARRLEQVLDHLLDNAVKYTERGEVELTVMLRAELSERVMLEFVVRDTGSGLGAEQREQLFTAFAQTRHPERARRSGAGLGLAIAKRLAEMMGGEIWVESAPGKGSSFHFTARFYRPNPMVGRALALPAAPQAKERRESAGHTHGLEVLLVEDDELNQKVAATLLRSLGHRPVVVSNGAEAIVAWETTRFDLMLLDLQMPIMGGLEAARYIRDKENVRGGHLPIIALTAHADQDYRARCAELAIEDFLVKPVEKDILAAAVDRAAGRLREAPGAPAARLAGDAVLDLDAARARINNDAALFRKVLVLFRNGYAEALARCEKAVAENDPAALATAAHGLKGMAGNIGANSLRAAAARLEKDAREAHREVLAERVAAVRAAVTELIPRVDAELALEPLAAAS